MHRKTPAGQTAGVHQISSQDDVTPTAHHLQAPFIDLTSKQARVFQEARLAYRKNGGWQNFHRLRDEYLKLAGGA